MSLCLRTWLWLHSAWRPNVGLWTEHYGVRRCAKSLRQTQWQSQAHYHSSTCTAMFSLCTLQCLLHAAAGCHRIWPHPCISMLSYHPNTQYFPLYPILSFLLALGQNSTVTDRIPLWPTDFTQKFNLCTSLHAEQLELFAKGVFEKTKGDHGMLGMLVMLRLFPKQPCKKQSNNRHMPLQALGILWLFWSAASHFALAGHYATASFLIRVFNDSFSWALGGLKSSYQVKRDLLQLPTEWIGLHLVCRAESMLLWQLLWYDLVSNSFHQIGTAWGVIFEWKNLQPVWTTLVFTVLYLWWRGTLFQSGNQYAHHLQGVEN